MHCFLCGTTFQSVVVIRQVIWVARGCFGLTSEILLFTIDIKESARYFGI